MTEVQARRLRELRSRQLVRAFDYRQRRHARGVWFRLRRTLAFASDAYVLDDDDAQQLLSEGCAPEPVGQELEPPRIIVFAAAERVARLTSARAVAVRLDAELLGARFLALVPFDTGTGLASGPMNPRS